MPNHYSVPLHEIQSADPDLLEALETYREMSAVYAASLEAMGVTRRVELEMGNTAETTFEKASISTTDK